ncbi:Arylesterase [Candidatus Bilamarchaeum dharawalense]|uniref:Arylesterase n=1 Tax=Candidatus Bilamarchaeum dharawalense TaxID=2885759 RepID=A0A5E4LW79_9ARCH|nr:Arylesterase [Candidatus Bilamarchaeum dharawalense]
MKNILGVGVFFGLLLFTIILTGCCSALHRNSDSGNPILVTNDSDNDFYTPPEDNTTTTPSLGDKKNIRYGTTSLLQIFDFYAPSQQSDTLVIVIHGGAWVAGDKGYMAPIAQFLAKNGYSVVNMDYRLAPMSKYPAPMEDISSVLKYVDSNKEQFSLKDNYRIVLLGHSAGAHLSALYGLKESEFNSVNVDKVVGLAGPYDFVTLEEQGAVSLALDSFLGSTPKIDVSPASQVKAGETTQYLLILGSSDELVPVSQLTAFETALKAKYVPVETLVVSGRDHNGIINQIPQNDVVAQKILTFVG